MGRVPEYASQVVSQLTPQQAPAALNKDGERISRESRQQLTQIANTMFDMKNVREATKAETDFKLESAQIKQNAANDPNPDNAYIYKDQINKAQERSASTISHPPTRMKASANFKLNAGLYNIDIDSNFIAKGIAATNYELDKSLTVEHEDYKQTLPTPKGKIEREKAKMAAKFRIDDAVATKVMTGAEGIDARNTIDTKWDVDWRETQIEAAIAFDPAQAKIDIAGDMFGNRDEFTDKERRTWTAVADAEEARDITLAERARTENIKVTEKAYATAAVKDKNSIDRNQVKNDALLGNITDGFRDELYAFKTKVFLEEATPESWEVANEIQDMIGYTKKRKDGTPYTDQEIAQYIMANSERMTQEDSDRLMKGINTDRKSKRKETQTLEATGLKAYLTQVIAPADEYQAMETTPLAVTQKIAEFMYEFNREVDDLEKASPEQIRDIADAYKFKGIKDLDPTFRRKKDTNLNRIRVHPVGQDGYDKDGNKFIMNDLGDWLPVTPEEATK